MSKPHTSLLLSLALTLPSSSCRFSLLASLSLEILGKRHEFLGFGALIGSCPMVLGDLRRRIGPVLITLRLR